LADGARTTYRFAGYSTNYLKYYIPDASSDGMTNSLTVKFEPETDFTFVEVFMSLDSSFKIIEERPAQHILEDGIAIEFNSNDYYWCTRCDVYLIINTIESERLYVTAKAESFSDTIYNG